ncbi:hypothetical protein AVEN_217723-1 [Araneus ventricosus]|uniref:Uncharacterized protein n=1 Tax=Araneus ventricosus TaxID=182803 RepID=A0A4Y2NLU7_ARAVE|nr:hypothetical protein AVEN_217723-1 [Araneus ventricosus]
MRRLSSQISWPWGKSYSSSNIFPDLKFSYSVFANPERGGKPSLSICVCKQLKERISHILKKICLGHKTEVVAVSSRHPPLWLKRRGQMKRSIFCAFHVGFEALPAPTEASLSNASVPFNIPALYRRRSSFRLRIEDCRVDGMTRTSLK